MHRRPFKSFVVLTSLWALSCSAAWAEVAPVFHGEEVVVTASRMPQLRSELPASVTVITSTEIETLGAKNMGDVLNYTYGTSTRTTGYLGSQVSGSIRGSTYQQMLILIDGQRINSPLLGGYDLGTLPVDYIDRVEIVRGPASALYGADAVGGVVNIITKKSGNNDKYALNVSSKLSEQGGNELQLATSGVADSLGYSFSAGKDFSPGFRDNSDYTAQKFSGDISKRFSEQLNLNLGYDQYNAKEGVPGPLSSPSPLAREEDNNQHLRLLSEIKVYDNWSMKLNSSFSQLNSINNDADPVYGYRDKNDSSSDLYECQNEIKLGENDLLNLGAEYRNDQSVSTSSGDHLVYNKALSIQDQHYFTPDLSLLLSNRYDSHSVYGDTSSPRVGINYKLNSDSSIWASYGEAFRAPTLNDLFWYDPYDTGNPSLKPESSKNSEIGLTLRPDERTELNASYFTSQITDLIVWELNSYGTYETQNVASASISGYEVGLSYYVIRELKCFVNYTAMNAVDGTTRKDLLYKPGVQYNAGLEYNDGRNDSAGIIIDHVGDRYDDGANTIKVDPYTITNINFRFQVDPVLAILFGAENFFNEDYQETFDYPMPGRIYSFGIQYNLI